MTAPRSQGRSLRPMHRLVQGIMEKSQFLTLTEVLLLMSMPLMAEHSSSLAYSPVLEQVLKLYAFAMRLVVPQPIQWSISISLETSLPPFQKLMRHVMAGITVKLNLRALPVGKNHTNTQLITETLLNQ